MTTPIAPEADEGEPRPLVLHVPFTFFPDASGGTEVYVLALARHLTEHGYVGAVAAPCKVDAEYVIDGIPVYRFAIDARQGIEHAYGRSDEVAAASFAKLIGRLRPCFVHLHARTAAVSERLAELAHEAGARVVFTYHTPTVSCARGTMLLNGREPCDGMIRQRRCVACVLRARGAPPAAANLAALLPASVARSLAAIPALPSALRMPGLLIAAQSRFRSLMGSVDHVVAVCDWVAGVLRSNGVPEAKMTVSRQGLGAGAGTPPQRPPRPRRPVRVAYFGRLDVTKGADLLVSAMARIPAADVAADLYLVRQSGSERDLLAIEAQARVDRRINIHPALPADQVRDAMAAYDLIAVPSRWLETGPLVVLEAFSAGVPVLGADRGGIAELVQDGVNGILFLPDDIEALAGALSRIAADPESLDKLRAGISKPRTMSEVAGEMAQIYLQLSKLPDSAPGSRLAPAEPATSGAA